MDLYNSLSQTLEPFIPINQPVSVYVCGITPYDTTHLGHAFTYHSADILIRYLEYLGNTVRYVQNVTDIDDDILRKANQVGEDWHTLGNQWTAHFIEDMKALNIRPPDEYPRATETIAEIIEFVQRLLESGLAYYVQGNVYYDVRKWSGYGKLSHLSWEDMLPIANQRGNKPDDPHKRHPLDFVLWQAKAPGEPAWESPWGPGRPGWHIECSAMSISLLGKTVDIHMGGADLIFPHHESEIAQVEPINQNMPFVRYWAHTAMVHYQGEKMSKSLGNLVMVNDLMRDWSPDHLRVYLASHHYRQVWSYDPDQLRQAAQQAERIREAVIVTGGMGESLDYCPYRHSFLEAMDNDLDTPNALQTLEDLAREILHGSQVGKDIQQAQLELRELSNLFGLRLDDESPEPRVIDGWNKHLQRFTTRRE